MLTSKVGDEKKVADRLERGKTGYRDCQMDNFYFVCCILLIFHGEHNKEI